MGERTPENRPELARVAVEQEPERTWPPPPGKLMIRRLSQWNDKEEKFELIKEDLHFFTEVGKPGEKWESQHVAKVDHYKGGFSMIQPMITRWTESATQRETIESKKDSLIEHLQASDEDLKRFTKGVLEFYQDQDSTNQDQNPEKAEKYLQGWVQELVGSLILEASEKHRVVMAVSSTLIDKNLIFPDT